MENANQLVADPSRQLQFSSAKQLQRQMIRNIPFALFDVRFDRLKERDRLTILINHPSSKEILHKCSVRELEKSRLPFLQHPSPPHQEGDKSIRGMPRARLSIYLIKRLKKLYRDTC